MEIVGSPIAIEVTKATIARIEEVNPILNAVAENFAEVSDDVAGAIMKLNSGTNRVKIAQKMTNANILKGQAVARDYMSSSYLKCGY